MNLPVYLLNIALLAGLVWWLRRQAWAQELGVYFYPALLFKLVCGILLGLLYFEYYGAGDTITYHKAALRLTAYAKEDFRGYLRLLLFNEFADNQFRASVPFSRYPNFSNSFFMLKLVSALNLLTNSTYYLNSLYFSLFSFWGTAKLASVPCTILPDKRRGAVLAFLFFPSVVFWGSGLLKDSVMMGSMCWVVAFALQVAHQRRVGLLDTFLFLLMLYLYVRIKIFLSAPLVAILVVYVVVTLLSYKFEGLRKLKVQLAVIGAFLLVAGVAVANFLFIFSPKFVFRQMMATHNALLKQSLHMPHLEYPHLEATWQSMLAYAPLAFLNAIYRPFLGEILHPLYLANGLENLVLLLLTFTALVGLFKKGMQGVTLLHVSFGLYILIIAVVVGLTTPNFGSLTRYRIAFLPFLVYLLLQNGYMQGVLKKLKLP